MGCFLPARHSIFIWETAWNRIFSCPKVCNVIRHKWNISRMAWRNVMIFFEDGKWHYIFDFMWFYHNQNGVFWEISQKLCFWGFLLFLQKWPSYIKNRLGPLFFTTKPTYSLNLVKNGKAVWSESLVEVAALDRKQKWTITLQWTCVCNKDKYVCNETLPRSALFRFARSRSTSFSSRPLAVPLEIGIRSPQRK